MLFFHLAAAIPLVAQFESPDTLKQDTARVAVIDSSRYRLTPLSSVGSIDRTLAPGRVTADSSIPFTDYEYLGDILSGKEGIFIRNLGSPGQFHGLTVSGLDSRSVAVLSDGVLLNEPFTGTYDLNLFPTEHVDRIEIVPQTEAFLYGMNGTGGAINLVSKSRKALRPYSRLRYSESLYEYGFIDGMFSQDVIRGLNMTAGAQHVTADGRFPNSSHDAWNARVKLRYNVSSTFNLFASEKYDQAQTGLNGGVDTSTPPDLRFERLQAVVRNTDAYEKITRHDVQVGAAARLFADSTALSVLTLYHSTHFREYRDEENRPNSNSLFIHRDDRSQWFGAALTQHLPFDRCDLDLGAEIQRRGLIASGSVGRRLETAADIRGKSVFRPFEHTRLSLYGRFDGYLSLLRFSYGAGMTFSPAPWVELTGGYSRSYRFPTFQELYWRDSVVSADRSAFLPERHHLLEAGFRLVEPQRGSFSLRLFRRVIRDAVAILPVRLTYPFPALRFILQQEQILQGIESAFDLRFGPFVAEGSTQFLEFTADGSRNSTLPKWSSAGGLYFWDGLFNNHLGLKAGFRLRWFSSFDGTEFNPEALMFVPDASSPAGSSGAVDFILIGHLGNAHVHFIWENLSDRQYVVTSFYPMPDRAVRFGISWEFFD